MPNPAALERQAEEVATWLREHIAGFPPLEIIHVESSVISNEWEEPIVELIVVVKDPESPDEGWPVEAKFALYGAVNQRAAETNDIRGAYVRLQAESSRRAA